MESTPNVSGSTPKVMEHTPNDSGSILKVIGNIPNVVGSTPIEVLPLTLVAPPPPPPPPPIQPSGSLSGLCSTSQGEASTGTGVPQSLGRPPHRAFPVQGEASPWTGVPECMGTPSPQCTVECGSKICLVLSFGWGWWGGMGLDLDWTFQTAVEILKTHVSTCMYVDYRFLDCCLDRHDEIITPTNVTPKTALRKTALRQNSVTPQTALHRYASNEISTSGMQRAQCHVKRATSTMQREAYNV
jgi:hypothetical protein